MANSKKMSVSEFKAKSLGMFEEVATKHLTIIVTKRGRPMAKISPIDHINEEAHPKPNQLKGTIEEVEDIVKPLGEKLWKAAK